MKHLNVVEICQKEVDKTTLNEARIYMIEAQIRSLERLIESGEDDVKCPTCWNTVSQLLDRLKVLTPAIWISAEEYLQI
jgi:hypothetical protein